MKAKTWTPQMLITIVFGIIMCGGLAIGLWLEARGQQKSHAYDVLMSKGRLVNGTVRDIGRYAPIPMPRKSKFGGNYDLDWSPTNSGPKLKTLTATIEYVNSEGRFVQYDEFWNLGCDAKYQSGDSIGMYYLESNPFVRTATVCEDVVYQRLERLEHLKAELATS